MNEELTKHKLDVHEKRINNHSDRIDKLEQNQARLEVQIQNLVLSLDSLTAVLKWLIGLGAGALVSFFFYAIQNNLF